MGQSGDRCAQRIAPPVVMNKDEDRCWAEFDLGAAYEGPPDHVHGGSALILDHMLGEVASLGGIKPTSPAPSVPVPPRDAAGLAAV
jgi:hypothetical protein